MGFSSEIEKLERRWQDNPLGLTFVPYAEALRKAGETARALELLEVGLGRHPNYVPAHIVRGRCQLDAQAHDQAELSFLRVTELDPENIIALKSLADVSERVGRISEAIQRLETLLDVDRNNEEARAQLDRLREAPVPEAAPAGQSGAATAPEVPPDAAAIVASEPSLEESFQALDLDFEDEASPTGGDASPQERSEFQLANDSDTLRSSNHRLEDVLLGSGTEFGDEVLPASFESLSPDEAEPVREFEPEPLLPEASPTVTESFAAIVEVVPPAPEPFSSFAQEIGGEPPPPVAEAVPVEAAEPEPSPVNEAAEPEPSPAAEAAGPPLQPAEPWLPVAAVETGWPGRPTLETPAPAEPVAPAEAMPSMAELTEPLTEAPAGSTGTAQPAAEAGQPWMVEPTVHPEPVPAEASVPGADTGAEAPPAPWEESAALEPEPVGPIEEVAEFHAVTEVIGIPEQEPEAVREPVGTSEPEPAGEEPELVVTETMAEIFLRQGHRELALAVYAQLSQRDPANERAASALERLRSELAPAAAAPPVPEPRFDAASSGGTSVESFFSSLLSAPRPSVAATVHPPAFESRRRPLGEPTRPAEEALSLSAVFGEESAPPAPAGTPARSGEPSFDEFFAPATGPAAEVELPRPPSDTAPAQVPEDLEQFNAWLRGLKR